MQVRRGAGERPDISGTDEGESEGSRFKSERRLSDLRKRRSWGITLCGRDPKLPTPFPRVPRCWLTAVAVVVCS